MDGVLRGGELNIEIIPRTCHRTQKRVYLSAAEALASLEYLQVARGLSKLKRTYKCEFCGYYHLTSKAKMKRRRQKWRTRQTTGTTSISMTLTTSENTESNISSEEIVSTVNGSHKKTGKQLKLYEAFRNSPGEVMPINEIGRRAGFDMDDPQTVATVQTAIARMATLDQLNVHRVARGIYVHGAPAPTAEKEAGKPFVPESEEVKIHALDVATGETEPTLEWLGEVDGNDIYRKGNKLYALVPVRISYGE